MLPTSPPAGDNKRVIMKTKKVIVGGKTGTKRVSFGGGSPLALIAGPCVIEGEKFTLQVAEKLAKLARQHHIPLVFKASFDKANRTSAKSFRGPGLKEGLRILSKVRRETGLPVLTDVHEQVQAYAAGEVVDAIQVPAFLARQTDLLVAAARTGIPINIKKGQFMAPEDMAHAVEKIRSQGNPAILLTERGTSFGYHNLVVDMRSIPLMGALGVPVIFDATHSVQTPSSRGGSSGGRREFIPILVRAACAAGVDALFIETHPTPDKAMSDGPNSWPLHQLEELWCNAVAVWKAARPT